MLEHTFFFCEVHKHRESHQDDNHPQGRFRYKFAYGMIFGGVHAVKVLIFANIVKIKKTKFYIMRKHILSVVAMIAAVFVVASCGAQKKTY